MKPLASFLKRWLSFYEKRLEVNVLPRIFAGIKPNQNTIKIEL